MRGTRFTWRRLATVLAVLLCLGPPLAVALIGMGASVPAAILFTLLAAALLVRLAPEFPLGEARRRPALAALWIAVLVAGAVQTSRASLYANDATRPEHSIVPGNPWRVEHSCFTAYAEGARFASEGVENIYERSLYVPAPGRPRHIGPLKVDPFHYPPTFLLLPGVVRALAPEFFDTRRVWFGLQALVLGGAFLAVAWWVGGEQGRRVALLGLLAWATPTTFASLQMGNFQVTAVPMALMGMMLAWSRREPAGGALLAYTAAGKVFPSMLVLHAATALRWRAIAWIVGAGVTFAVVTAAVFGTAPFVEFVRDEFPRLVSGASFPQTEVPGVMPVNMSVYGLTAKLRQLGAAWLDQPAGKHVAQLYALLLALFVVWAGSRVRGTADRTEPRLRLLLAILWLAILNLASLGGPFVPVMYGIVGTLWLLALLAAAADARFERWTWIVLLVVMTTGAMLIPTPRPTELPAASTLAFSVIAQAGIFAVNVFAAGTRALALGPARVRSAVPAPAV